MDFLDIVTRGREGIEFRLEEFGVPKESPLANHTIGELQIGEKTGAIVLAIRSGEGRFDTTPSAQDRLLPGDTLIVLGTREQIGRLETLMAGREPVNENPCSAVRIPIRRLPALRAPEDSSKKSAVGLPKVVVRIGR